MAETVPLTRVNPITGLPEVNVGSASWARQHDITGQIFLKEAYKVVRVVPLVGAADAGVATSHDVLEVNAPYETTAPGDPDMGFGYWVIGTETRTAVPVETGERLAVAGVNERLAIAPTQEKIVHAGAEDEIMVTIGVDAGVEEVVG